MDNIKNMFIICSSGFILNSKNEFLMLRRSANDNFLPDCWELPGGRLEMGEDLVTGLQREVKEESGLDVEVMYPLRAVSYYLDPENPRESYGVFYLCKLQDKNQKISASEEHSDYKWVSFDDFSQLKITNFLKKLILPGILPYLFAAFKTSSSLAVVGALVGEFIGSNKGLGFLIMSNYYTMNIPLVFAAITTSSIFGILFYYIIHFFEKRMVFDREKIEEG